MLHGRLDQGAEPIDLHRRLKFFSNSFRDRRQPKPMRFLQPFQLFTAFGEQGPRQQFAPLLPQESSSPMAFGNENFMTPIERTQLPEVPIVSGLDSQEIQKDIELVAVIRLWARAVVLLV